MEILPRQTAEAEEAVRIYADMVYRLAFSQVRNKSDADDIFQEVFLRYLKKLPRFGSEEHRKAWLIRVTVNCAKKHWSSAWNKRVVALEDNLASPPPEENGLSEALERLPPKYRAVIHLFYYEGYKVEQIGRILKLRQSTVRTRLTRARVQLGAMLKGEFDV